ncbi:MAG TPA: Dyp-type peroxidase [Puia sp.]|nr:Dyp-type peroxidase [Puia sp.]
MEEPLLAADDIQGNIAPGFKLPFQCLIGMKGDKVTLLEVLALLAPKITTMRRAAAYHIERVAKAKATGIFGIESFRLPAQQQFCWINLAMGRDFLRRLNIGAPEAISPAFATGLYDHSFDLGDSKDPSQESFHDNWAMGNKESHPDLFLLLGSDDGDTVQAEASALKAQFGALIHYSEFGNRLDNDTEHFGFRDGVSLPSLRGYTKEGTYLEPRKVKNIAGNSPEYASPGSILIWPGQFIFGYPKQDHTDYRSATTVGMTNDPDLVNGSLLVFRRLKQDVQQLYADTDAFSAVLRQDPTFASYSGEKVRAKLVGRWKTGQPLTRNPDDPTSPFDPAADNYFLFKVAAADLQLENGGLIPGAAGDFFGEKCPMSAHIRKVNPRDLPTDLGSEVDTLTFRPMRRGIPFGPKYDFDHPDNPQNKQERGLLFLAYVTDIQAQFENLQEKWANTSDKPEEPKGFDMILGQNPAGGRWCQFNGAGQPFQTMAKYIIPTGGEYLFVPSLTLVHKIIAAK